MKISPLNSFLSITDGGLFVSSHTTLKSVIPLALSTSLKKGLTCATKFALVISSLNSNSENWAAFAIAFSRIIKSLLTLILSKEEGFANKVLSPNNTLPPPAGLMIGLIPFIYKSSLSALLLSNAKLSTFFKLPLLNPAGEIKGFKLSEAAHRPAISPLKGTYLYFALYLSYWYL